MKAKVAFLGAGSHADAIRPLLDSNNYDFIGYFDDKDIKEHDGSPILGKMYDVLDFLRDSRINKVFVTIGENAKRKELFDYVYKEFPQAFFNIVSPDAQILTPESIVGVGNFIGHGAFVGSKARIANNIVINTRAVVEHHSQIDSHCNIAPSVTINGLCHLEEEVYVGSSATLIQVLTIASKTMIGAGAVVVKSILEPGTYVGVPAKKVK